MEEGVGKVGCSCRGLAGCGIGVGGEVGMLGGERWG
jgi:hypothetical protein